MALARANPVPSGSQGLIERDEPLAALGRYLDEGATAVGRLVLVRGEAGVGKTALLRAFVDACPPDVTVLWGACDGVSTPQPFGPLEDMVPALGPQLRTLLDSNAPRAEVGRLVLDRLSTGGTHIFVLEDIQWADDATLELLAFLARRMESLQLLVLVTHRDGDGQAPNVARILGSLASLAVVRQLPLSPLTRAGVARLARGRDVDIDDLYRITAGNPFYVNEVLDAGGGRIPVSVLDAVRARVAQLDQRGRRALEAAAVIGVRSEPWLLAAITGEDLIGIDDCLQVGLLSKAEGIAFRHELTRMAVLQDLPVIHGIALHRLALMALERAGTSDAARLAYHAEGAADRQALLQHASAAGRRALAMGALHEAATQFQRALPYADSLGGEAHAELLESLAQALFLINHLADAYEVGKEAVTLRRQTGNARMAATDLSSLALTTWANGHGEEAWQAGREAVALLESSGDSHELGIAYATLGRLGVSTGLNGDARATSERALEIGRRLHDPEVTAIALANIGTVALFEGDGSGWASLEESLLIGRQANLPPIVDRALNNLGVGAAVWRRLPIAESYFDELEEHSDRSEIERCSIHSARAEIALALGDWDAAELHARAAFAAARTDPVDRALAMIVLARLAIRRGQDGWHAWLVEPVELAERLGTTQLRWPLAAVAAEHGWQSESMGSALPELREAYAEACEQRDSWAIGELGQWLWRAGELSELDQHAATPYRLEVAGNVSEAAVEWERLGMPYETALCLAGSSDPADLHRAHALLAGLGADVVTRKVALRLRQLGAPVPRGPRPRTRSNPGGLTEREEEISQLLAEGLSNAEIADRLVLSPKTVGNHVSAVLAKLAVRRRAEVAAAIRETGAPI